MKIVALSDMHGQLNVDVESCDIVCICGDIVPLSVQRNDSFTFQWLRERFIPWCNDIECEHVLLVGGNHDFGLYNRPDLVKKEFEGTKIHYLFDEEFIYTDEEGKEFKFYGSPWCHQFYNWAFMNYTDEELLDVFDNIPNDVDVLLTHDAPYGYSDIVEHKPEHIGCPALRDKVLEKCPRILFHGHLHTADHEEVVMPNGTSVYNVSILNEAYHIAYKPLILNIF